MNVIGVDQSLTHTAVHVAHGGWDRYAIKTDPKKFADKLARLEHIHDVFVDGLPAAPGVAYVEGYGFNTQKGHSLGELGGLLQFTLYRAGWTIVLVPPATLKKFVSGKGGADKALMLREVFRRWGYEATNDNDCDAFSLLAFGLIHQWHLNGLTVEAYSRTCASAPELSQIKPATKADVECFAKIEIIRRAA